MKAVRGLCSLVIVVAILFALPFSAGAIGFDAETAYESVFVIYSGSAMGSGFAIGENCVVTNAHVVDDPDSILVTAYDGTEYDAAVLGLDEETDIAVLVIEGVTFPYLHVADLSQMKTGDDIYAIGAPKGMAYTLTKGGISAKERTVGSQTYIQIDAPINEGNSGGPLLNDAGEVLGMNTLKMSDSEGIGLSITITEICGYLQSLGIQLDEGGNVAAPVELPEPEVIPSELPEETVEGTEPQEVSKAGSPITWLAILVAVISLVTNVVLATLLANEKKKCATLLYDPKERTDFDIDILE